jgi:hypothetical protein
LFIQQKDVPFYENTCSLGKLDEKLNHKKIQSFEIWKEKATWQKTHFLTISLKKYVQWVQNV